MLGQGRTLLAAATRACVVLIACLVWTPATAGADEPLRAESRYLFQPVPDGTFTASDGRTHRLSEFWDDRPVLLNLFFRRCTGSCSPLMHSIKRAVDATGGLGRDYTIVSLSFDPGDTTADLRAMAASLELPAEAAWYVGTADPETIDRIAGAIGFWYTAVPGTDQFDHPSLLAAVRGGKVVRILAGNVFDRGRVRDLLLELGGVWVPFAPLPQGGSSLRCFRFDERTNSLKLDWGLLLLFAPGFGAFATAGVVFLRRRGTRDV